MILLMVDVVVTGVVLGACLQVEMEAPVAWALVLLVAALNAVGADTAISQLAGEER